MSSTELDSFVIGVVNTALDTMPYTVSTESMLLNLTASITISVLDEIDISFISDHLGVPTFAVSI